MKRLMLIGCLMVAGTGMAGEPKYETDSLKPFPMIAAPVPAKYNEANHVGCPSLAISPGGRLWCGWLAGGTDGEGDSNYVYLQTSGDGGKTWSGAVQVVDCEGPLRVIDPGLWTDPSGNVWLYWGQLYSFWDGRAGLFAAIAKDPERADTAWTTPRRLTDGYMKNKPIVLKSGEWVFPVEFMQFDSPLQGACKHLKPNRGPYAHPELGGSERMHGVYISKDCGKTFVRGGIAPLPREKRDCPEDMIVERRDGSLWMMGRTKYGIGESVSTDKGMTWTPMEHGGIRAPNTRFFLGRLASGAILLVKNLKELRGEPMVKAYSINRNCLTAFLSDDDGKTWTNGFVIDGRPDVTYPDCCQGKDGEIHIVYDRGRMTTREIFHAVITEADIRAGKIVSKGSRLRDVVYFGGKANGKGDGKQEQTWIYHKKDDARDLLKELIAIPSASVNVGEVNRAVDVMKTWLTERGVSCAEERDESGRKILWASTRPGKEQDVVFVCHLDVVPAPKEMFALKERDGRFFGRGVCDCKANAVVCAEVLSELVGKASVGCVFSTDEEIGGKTTALMVARGYRPRKMAIVVDLAEYGAVYAHKGHAVLKLVAHGSNGHSSAPWKSENALERLIVGCAKARTEWDCAYPKASAQDQWHDTLSITMASSSSEVANAVPDRAEAMASLRYVAADGCRKAVEFLKAASGLEVEVVRDGGPVNSNPNDPLMTAFLARMRKVWKDESLRLERVNGATDARHLAALGKPIVIIGSESGGAHSDGEWCEIAGLDRLRTLLKETAK